MRLLASLLVFLVASVVAAGAAGAAGTHPFSVHDMIAMDRISDPKVSPDGTRVVFTVSVLDLPANKRRNDLYLVGADGKDLRKLTSNDASDTSPQWSPDGRSIYFLSTRSGSSQVWKLSMDGGEAIPVTRLPLDVGGFLLSPIGAKIAVTLDVFVDLRDPGVHHQEARGGGGEEIHRHGLRPALHPALGYVERRSAGPLVRDADRGGDPVDVMKGMDADSPSKPFGGSERATFTPDGKSLVFTAKNAGREEAWSTNFDLFVSPIDASATPRNLTASNKAWDTQPLFLAGRKNARLFRDVGSRLRAIATTS
jgi:dipeptidyl aminopeptidase/acylaminoacyl peptidase